MESSAGCPRLSFQWDSEEGGAVQCLLDHGVVHLEGKPILSEQELEACQEASKERFQQIYSHLLLLTQTYGSHPATAGGTKEVVERDGCRFDMRYRMDEAPFQQLQQTGNWMQIVRKVLCTQQPKLQWAGVVVAAASEGEHGRNQAWHADGEHLFDSVPCPPHCVNVFVPLVGVDSLNGATEFRPGSHRQGHGGPPGVQSDSIRLCAKAGECIIFDYRCWHRGGANNSGKDRHVLYFTYGKEWWSDVKNHRSSKSLFSETVLQELQSNQDKFHTRTAEEWHRGLEMELEIADEKLSLSVPAGADIDEAVSAFCQQHGIGNFTEEVVAQVRAGIEAERGAMEAESVEEDEAKPKYEDISSSEVESKKRSASEAGLDPQ
eukprot:TRINITY_DN7433_c0_g1_i1.p1 TRINITY_DN7433_c0_g1~~TRINITY_DN7433_c0_g1_i1.p1  ORF type:complete len:377 (-),score=81.24 TRINITY_DN7433_c0_g1_i1:574-1704(-)